MEWQSSSSSNNTSSNPWVAPSAIKALNRNLQATPYLEHASIQVASNPLVEGQESSIESRNIHLIDNGIEATRPSLSRLTSSSGLGSLLQGLDKLALRSGNNGTALSSLGNASTESLSTQDGHRRSLDELRRLRIKGKSRAIDPLDGHDLGWAALENGGREALLHQVDKGDNLMGIALLYGCTVQSIRTANKLWLNDPIQLRKTLYVPLDACTQPPSRQVEFVQVQGENELQLYFRGPASATLSTSSLMSSPIASSSMTHNGQGQSIQQSITNSTSSNALYRYPETPSLSSQLPSSSSSQTLKSNTTFPYLSDTNSEYADSSEYLPSLAGDGNASSTGYRTPPIPSSDVQSMATTKKSLQIVQIPHSAKANLVNKGKSPLTVAKDLDKPLSHFESSPLTPSSSSDRLSTLVPGSSPNLRRIRTRGPLQPTADTADTPTTLVYSPSPLLGGDIPKALQSQVRSSSPSRKRKSSKPDIPPPNLTKKASSNTNLISAGSGLLSSLLGAGGGGKQWLGVDEYQEEMQLARDYRSRKLFANFSVPDGTQGSFVPSKSIETVGSRRDAVENAKAKLGRQSRE